MAEKKSTRLFDRIAPVYGLFYARQKRRYARIADQVKDKMDVDAFQSALDVGCGTGALCAVLNERGLTVTGIDPAAKMLDVARRQPENKGIRFLQGSALDRLPFADNAFDLVIASYVAHGLQADDRRKLYAEMGRVAREVVIIHDYNGTRSLLTTLVEWLEGGDYFHFIRHAEDEMKACLHDMKACFSGVEVLQVDTRASSYICKPV